MSEIASMRAFNREVAAVVGASVEVEMTSGKTYIGTVRGIDQNTMTVVLSDAKLEGEGESIPKIFIYGKSIASFSVAQEEFSLEGLSKELEKTFPPGGVRFFPDTGVIVVMNKIRITQDGVDGTGPLYERVLTIYNEWMEEHGLG
jgi:small nuclear ribonucleoprotein (snRNP)-like protein